MLERAEEEDAILAGTSSTYSDVGFTQTKGALKNEDIDVNDENTSIQSMSQKKNAENRASKMKNEINQKENSDKNKKLFKNINEKVTLMFFDFTKYQQGTGLLMVTDHDIIFQASILD